MRWNPIEQIQDVANKFGSEDRIKLFQSGELILVERNPQTPQPILDFIGNIPMTARRFVAKESFTKTNTMVKFGYIDEHLPKLFGSIQEDTPAGALAVHRILRISHDPDIMVAMGPQARRFTRLGQFYQALEAQGHGQAGQLLVNGYANIAYIIDENGAPWAFYAFWIAVNGGWDVRVHSVAERNMWFADFQVLSQVAQVA